MVDPRAYDQLFWACLGDGDTAGAAEVVARGPPEKRAATFTALLNAHVEAGDTEAAWALLQEMSACHVRPTHRTYNVMLKAYAQSGDGPAAAALVDAMWEDPHLVMAVPAAPTFTAASTATDTSASATASTITIRGPRTDDYNALMLAHLRGGASDAALALFGSMLSAQEEEEEEDEKEEDEGGAEEPGKRLPPADVVTFNTLVEHYYAPRGDAAGAKALTQSMALRNISPDQRTHDGVVRAFLTAGSPPGGEEADLPGAIAYLEGPMAAAGFTEPHRSTSWALLRALKAAGDTERAAVVMRGMVARGLASDDALYAELVGGEDHR